MHIEFVGPPGAGKSAIHSALTNLKGWYGPKPERASRRQFFDTVGVKYKFLYLAMPSSYRKSFDSAFLEPHFFRKAFSKFANQNENTLQYLLTVLGSIEREPAQLLCYIKQLIEQYQIGLDTVHDNEHLCIDECFTIMAVSLLWGEPSVEFSLENYIQRTPTPDVVIHVQAPPDICIERQRQRDRIGLPGLKSGDSLHKKQVEFQELCTAVVKKQQSQTRVLHIENTGSLEDAVGQIKRSLDEPSK